MQKYSLKKIFIVIAVILALTHLPQIVQTIKPVYQWFCKSLGVIKTFPEGMQSAIAIGLLLLVFVTVVKFCLNKDVKKGD